MLLVLLVLVLVLVLVVWLHSQGKTTAMDICPTLFASIDSCLHWSQILLVIEELELMTAPSFR